MAPVTSLPKNNEDVQKPVIQARSPTKPPIVIDNKVYCLFDDDNYVPVEEPIDPVWPVFPKIEIEKYFLPNNRAKKRPRYLFFIICILFTTLEDESKILCYMLFYALLSTFEFGGFKNWFV